MRRMLSLSDSARIASAPEVLAEPEPGQAVRSHLIFPPRRNQAFRQESCAPRPSAACPGGWLLLYDEKSVALQMLDQATGHDLRHDLVRVVNALAAVKPQSEGEGIAEVFGRRRRQSVGGLGHRPRIDRDRERRKERWSKPPSRRSLKMPLTRSPYSRSSRPVAGHLPGYDRLLSLGARHVHLRLRNHPIAPDSVAASLVRRTSASSKA